MKLHPIPLITICLLLSISIRAQELRHTLFLKSGAFIPEKNISKEELEKFGATANRPGGKTFAILQFETLPSFQQREQLKQSGIELLDYIPNNAYTATISGTPEPELLLSVQARAFLEPVADQKMQPQLVAGNFPAWTTRVAGSVEVRVSFPKTILFETVAAELKKRNIDLVSVAHKHYGILTVRVAVTRLRELASFSFIEWVEAAPQEDRPLNSNTMFASRANILRAPLALGGAGLDGQGVVVGVGDNGDVQSHIDFTGRLINRASHIFRGHAAHVTGTIGGAGIIQELYTGYAPRSTLVSQLYSNIFTNAPAYVQDYGMVITNNSYGSVAGDCYYNGWYDLSSRILDQQAFDLPQLQHVFAAGNDGDKNCGPATGFRTVLGGYQSAKNVLTVGSTDYKRDLSWFSSRGPVHDGRLKPEIMSFGSFVASTWVNNLYSYNAGTSMAAPGVSGGLALLWQRYRQLHGGANPQSGLMKTLVCNGGSDRGNPGPDFSYGFGSMNLVRSLAMLENNRYFISSLANNTTASHTINIPGNTAQLKVMLYWQDPPAAVMASKTLVNDLDLQVIQPSGSTLLPAILDSTAVNLDNSAVSGADHANNMEQVVINNPAAGNYSLRVNGTAITQNPSQEYFLVYDIIPESLLLTNPAGGESLVPTSSTLDTFYIQWDDYGGPSNSFTLEFSPDNGANWTTLNNAVNPATRIFSWPVPNIATETARIRLSKNGTSFTQSSLPFTITAMPVDSLTPVQCEGYISLGWRPVPGATDYEVMMLRNGEMNPVATTPALNYTFSGLSRDSIYYVTVRARINGKPGRRAVAVSRQPNSGSCAGSISDNDLKMEAILTNSTGRRLTATALSTSTVISARVKNLDNAAVTNFNLKYSINGGSWISESIGSGIAGGATYTHNFAVTQDFSNPGSYLLRVVVENSTTDPVPQNDTLSVLIRQLENNPLDLGSVFLDNIETASFTETNTNKTGLEGIDRYDFSRNTSYGRIRSFVNTGIAYSGNKALTLDATQNNPGTTNYLYGTFNLASYDPALHLVRLDFRFKNHGQQAHADNKVWIRGNDSSPWIEAYDLVTAQNEPGSFKRSASIELSRLLANNVQNFSTSFQVRWGQNGIKQATDNEGGAGYTFDDIRLYTVAEDMQVVSIDSPALYSCGLSSSTPVRITVRNTTNLAINNVPVKFSVDGGTFVTETIPTIAANSSLQYSFSAAANLSAPGNHRIDGVVSYAGDTFRDNDTISLDLVNLPVISSFPYLENFETGAGSWYAAGKYSSWEYGTPVSPRINRAASGSKAWKTRLGGYYNDSELSYLYSPCFNISGMTNPTLSFSLAMDIEDCGNILCDAAWVEYSTDGGNNWIKLGNTGQGTNWYNKNYSGNQVWSQQHYTRWHVATTSLPAGSHSSFRVRFVFDSDEGVTKEGIAIDDIHIYENLQGIYDGPTLTAPITQLITGGNSWVNFVAAGKLVASLQPNNQVLGNTDVQVYLHQGSVRNYNGQYYHNRNITIKPMNPSLTDSATIRFYFPDSENEDLLNATGCSTCTKPLSAYDLGISKYSDPDDAMEDGVLTNSLENFWSFIHATKAVKVPFDNGYYAEFKVKDFSEFWLNNGGVGNNQALPVRLTNFNASKTIDGKDVLVTWITASEININRFEIEVAKGNQAYSNGDYVKIGELASQGNSANPQSYAFTDDELNKSGARYYRLKIIDQNGSFSYSVIRPVLFSNDITWRVFPNPANNFFTILFQLNQGERLDIKMYDISGRLLHQSNTLATGFVQKTQVDLNACIFAKGLYLVEARGGEMKQVFRLLKQ